MMFVSDYHHFGDTFGEDFVMLIFVASKSALCLQGDNQLMTTLTGPGVVFIQSMPFPRLSQRIARFPFYILFISIYDLSNHFI